jgi:dTDP-glucose pyrophosphorylase
MNTLNDSWQNSIVSEKASVKDAILSLNLTGIKIVLVSDNQNRLVGVISDGDIRRGLLAGQVIDGPVSQIMRTDALTVFPELSRNDVEKLMLNRKVLQIPIVNTKQEILGIHLWDELQKKPSRENLMVIMAGGKGTRLHPKTENCPKPMLEIAGKPILQHIIERAKHQGFKNFAIAIQHLGHIIEEYFGNGENLGVSITYLREESPLGTAGALSLINPRPSEPVLVTNGDVITEIDFGGILDFHISHEAYGTMAVRSYEIQNPFGVVQIRDLEITSYDEKPVLRSLINAGVYVLSPKLIDLVPKGVQSDMPTVFEEARREERRIIAFPIHEDWMDIGRVEDLARAIDLGISKLEISNDR